MTVPAGAASPFSDTSIAVPGADFTSIQGSIPALQGR